MDALQSSPFSTNTSECGESHRIKFTKTEKCTPTACACILVALLFVSIGTAAGVYFGLQFLDLEKRNERVYKGSFVISGGDNYTLSLTDSLSEAFQEKAKAYKERLDSLYNNSVYKNSFSHSEILALNRSKDKKLTIHFNIHMAPEGGLSAADLYVVLSEEVLRSKIGVFKGLQIDYDSIQIQERRSAVNEAVDKWVPRRQYPGYVEGITSPPSNVSRIFRRQCTGIEVNFCHSLPYKETSYPNIIGHRNLSEVYSDLVTFRQIIDFECYPLAQLFICQLLQPECQKEEIIMPCQNFCVEFLESCDKLLPEKVRNIIQCNKLPSFNGDVQCHTKFNSLTVV